MDAKETVTEELHKTKERVSEKAHEFKEAAEETVTGNKNKKFSSGLINNAKEKILNRAHEIKGGAENVKESAKEEIVRDLKERARIIGTAVTDERTCQQKTTGLLSEGRQNFTNFFHRGLKCAGLDENVKWVLGTIRLIGVGTAYGTAV
ncbi:hypothetical protein BVC80_8861g23 [Macleaya cordata]|uniref:Uncharacterized protein n=1 Tax=Macleaya cordata TaxID=56857 RepID=A0A200Q5T1_MACCD|nr:hypothetical protein BVC80_8861g23 [Macleaya cordata]